MSLLDKVLGLFHTVGISTPIEKTGYSTMRSYLTLLDACFQGVNNPELRPGSDGTTHCNEFVAYVAERMGCKDLKGKLANDMIDYMTHSPEWTIGVMSKAQWLASAGTFVVAGAKDKPHGHVCVVIPGYEQRSIHWASPAPVCANVGKDVFMGKALSWAFREVPQFFVWRPTL